MNLLKKYYQRLLSRLEEKSLSRYYLTIKDMPFHNWIELHEKEDYSYLLKDKGKAKEKHAIKVMAILKDEFLNEFGVDSNYKDMLKKKIELQLLKIKMAVTGDKSHKIFADIIEVELENISKIKEGVSIKGNTIAIEKYMGFALRIREMSVFDYYSYVKEISNNINK